MAIGGGIKIFNKIQNLLADGASITATTGESSGNFCLDRNPLTFYRSVGSADVTTETLVITLPASTTIDRIFLVNHNFKSFTIKYDSATVFTDFTTVVGIDGALGGGITESTFSDNTGYYEFDEVTTTRIEITATLTQVVDAEKFLGQVIVTDELGTLTGYPVISGLTHSRNSKNKKALSGRMLIQKSVESAKMKLSFKRYPTGSTGFVADLDLMFTLFDRENDFLVWLCGGRRGTDYFKYTLRGFRLQDIYQMQVSKPLKVKYSKNLYPGQAEFSVSLEEVI